MPFGFPASRLPPFVRKAGGSTGLRIVGLGLQFAGSILIARMLGVEQFGVYAYAFTCVVIAGTLLSLGMGQLAVRELPRFLARGQPALVRGFLGLSFALVLAIGLACTGVLIWLDVTGRVALPIPWPWLALGMVVHALILNLSAVLSGFQRILQSQFLEAVLRQGLFLGVLLLLVFLGLSLDASALFRLSVLASLPILALMIWLVYRSLSGLPPVASGVARRQVQTRLWLASALPLLVMTFANQMQTNLDVLMIGILADAVDVGRYRAASRGADLMLIANSVAVQVLGPMLARALAGEDAVQARAEARRLITQSALVAALLGGGVCLVLGLGAAYYMGLFGADFLPAAPVLRILLIAQMIGILCGPVSIVLVIMGHERLVLVISLGALALNFTLNFTLIPIYGMLGAAWATFAAVVALKSVLMICVLRRCGFNPTLWGAWRRV